LWGRERSDYTRRYPELASLTGLPCGTVLDGELVILKEGRTDLPAMLGRHGLTDPVRIQHASRANPVTYVVFDLLSVGGQTLCNRPLRERQQMLAELLTRHSHPRLALSEPLAGSGCALFAAAVAQGHEGIMDKHGGSRYLPGQRSPAWRKIKPRHHIPCVIIGYREGAGGIGSLLVASQRDGRLQYVANLGSGLTDAARLQLGTLLAPRVCAKPVVSCPVSATWVRPELYCQVRFLEWTAGGRLRGACFAGLIENPACPAAGLAAGRSGPFL
jgi:bifunctional non-homologous end joining protein LigD